MNISFETVIKQAVCAALAVALTLLSTQSVVRSSGLASPAAPAYLAQQAAAPASASQTG
jgi:hypothetical protein